MWSGCTLGGALWLVVQDAAVGVQGERETAVKPLHGLVQGREPKHDRDDAHRSSFSSIWRDKLLLLSDVSRRYKCRRTTNQPSFEEVKKEQFACRLGPRCLKPLCLSHARSHAF